MKTTKQQNAFVFYGRAILCSHEQHNTYFLFYPYPWFSSYVKIYSNGISNSLSLSCRYTVFQTCAFKDFDYNTIF